MQRFRALLAVVLGGAIATVAFPAMAETAVTSPVVVELYTSQGCSSCPPADALLATLAERDDVIALALHVDIWDYIGWADTFGNPAFTARQRAYAKAVGARNIYTPQMVVQGTEHLVGTRVAELTGLIRAHGTRPAPVALTLERRGGSVRINAVAKGGAVPGGYVVQLVRYIPEATVSIGRGENSGRQISYVNIVTSWQAIADWDPATPLKIEARVAGDQPVVVIVQMPGHGAIVAAARLR